MNDDIQKQLEALLAEVRLLSRSVTHLRGDDFRLVFSEQIKPILIERIERYFSGKGKPSDLEAKAQLMDLVERYITDFQQKGTGAASLTLDEFMSVPSSDDPLKQDPLLTVFISALVGQMREYLTASDRISQQAHPAERPMASLVRNERALSPELVERTLGPLSSAHRIKVMLRLSNGDESLSSLSKDLAMKKGHLQFHLNVLTGPGLIAYDRKSHLYSITEKGARALLELSKLVEALTT